MTGLSVKELNQYRKARAKTNKTLNQCGSIETLYKLVHLHKSDRFNNQNLNLKAANTVVCNYHRNLKKVETFESKYDNLDDNLNHHAPPQDASPPAQDQHSLSLSFTNSCP